MCHDDDDDKDLSACAAVSSDAAAGVGRPLMVIVSRLTQQKGLPLMLHGIKVHSDLLGHVVLPVAKAWHACRLIASQYS
jgi:hypothetical protein